MKLKGQGGKVVFTLPPRKPRGPLDGGCVSRESIQDIHHRVMPSTHDDSPLPDMLRIHWEGNARGYLPHHYLGVDICCRLVKALMSHSLATPVEQHDLH